MAILDSQVGALAQQESIGLSTWKSKNGTLWLFNIAMGNDPFIDGLPIEHGDFPRLY